MHDAQDPLRSLFREAASAGQSGAVLPPVSDIARRGERTRRRRIVSVAAACLLVIGGTGTAVATLLPHDREPVLPATSPSSAPPSPVATSQGPSAEPSSTAEGMSRRPPQSTSTSPGPPPATGTSATGPSGAETSSLPTTRPPR
ncbi:hypothetical protein ACFWP3_02100 [Streptomyces sp. NPDC058525]|uniref:hypothetical protein n=1 Tax=unclassified Streptomyces TaxID=2593676 RepID=UPI003666CD0B